MTEYISIHPATLSDISTLAAIRTEAAETSLLTHFQFSPYHSIAAEKESDALISRLSGRFTEPDGQKFHLIKAVDSRNEETVGWGLVKWEDGSWVNAVTPSSAQAVAPDEEVGPTNLGTFGRYWSRNVIAKWRGITAGKPHVTIGAMNVKIAWQGKGVGRMMVEYMYREYELEKEVVIVQTTASAERFYEKMGWKTVDSTDIDLKRFPTLRTGGQQIDIKAQGIPILEKLGLLDTIRSYCVKEGGMEFVDRNGKSLMQFGITKAGDTARALTLTHEFEFMRGNFVKMMHDISIQEREILTTRGHVKGGLTYEFGKTITALSHSESSSSSKTATVTLSTGETRTFDLVIAADGQASRTRSLAFGSEISSSAFHSMNIHAAYYKIPRLPTEDSLARIYFASNNRMVMTRTGNQPATQVYLFLMNGKDKERASHMATYQKRSAEEQKDAWKSLYQDAGWECPRFLQGLDTVKDFYATEIGQVKMPQQKLYKDRVVLLGDAGYCSSPFTGMGTTLSLIGAYVLAGELFRHGDDVDAALEAYQEAMKQPVEECQKLGPYADGKGPLPSSERGLWMAGWALWTVSSLRVDRVIGWLAGLLPEGKEKRWEMPEYTEFNLAALKRE